MSRQHKIKRSYGPKGVYKARPHPLFVVFMALLFVGLVYLGIVIYQPVYNAIMSWGQGQQNPPELILPGDNGEQTPDPDLAPTPTPARPMRMGDIRAIYAPSALLENSAAFERFLEELPQAEINAVMVDIKNAQGHVLHTSRNVHANGWGAVLPGAIDLGALNRQLEVHGLSLVVRMSAFRDETAARGGGEDFAITFRGSEMMWLDNFPAMGGRPWLNPHSHSARQYITDLATEAVELGAVMVVLDDFQFPPNSLYTQDAYFGDTEGMSRTQRLHAFNEQLTAQLAAQGARLAVYMPAVQLAADDPNITFFGGPPVDILSEHTVVGALPYSFPFGFSSGAFALPDPTQDLQHTLRQVVSFVDTVLDSRMVVLIQGGSLPGGAQYSDEQIRAQVDTLRQLGVREFIFYAPYVGHYQVVS